MKTQRKSCFIVSVKSTPLIWAAMNNHTEIVNALINKGVNVIAKNV